MKRLFLVAALCCGCSERALDHCVGEDLSMPPDLSVPPDLVADLTHPLPDPCPAGARFIFTIEVNETLSRWNPVTQQFFPVGNIHCPTKLMGSPNSMAIARDGTGWVNYSSGELFHLDTTNAICTATPFAPVSDFQNWGMSFAQNSPGSSDETLFATSDQVMGPAQLASVDLINFVLGPRIDLGSTLHAELTGDDQANLWAFFPDTAMPEVARVDKMTGQLDRIFPLPSLAGTPTAWAFAAWNGDFYIFLERTGEASTTIYQLHSSDGSITTALANTGREILGVGVATCAGEPDSD